MNKKALGGVAVIGTFFLIIALVILVLNQLRDSDETLGTVVIDEALKQCQGADGMGSVRTQLNEFNCPCDLVLGEERPGDVPQQKRYFIKPEIMALDGVAKNLFTREHLSTFSEEKLSPLRQSNFEAIVEYIDERREATIAGEQSGAYLAFDEHLNTVLVSALDQNTPRPSLSVFCPSLKEEAAKTCTRTIFMNDWLVEGEAALLQCPTDIDTCLERIRKDCLEKE